MERNKPLGLVGKRKSKKPNRKKTVFVRVRACTAGEGGCLKKSTILYFWLTKFEHVCFTSRTNYTNQFLGFLFIYFLFTVWSTHGPLFQPINILCWRREHFLHVLPGVLPKMLKAIARGVGVCFLKFIIFCFGCHPRCRAPG